MQKRLLIILVPILLGLTLVSYLPLVKAASSPQRTLRVGLIVYPPFVVLKQGKYKGIAVDIWEEIAADQHWQYHHISFDEDVKKAIQQLQQGELDILVGPISTTYERRKTIDYTRPYFINIVSMAVENMPYTLGDTFARIAKSIIYTIGLISITCIVFLVILWRFERFFLSKEPREENSIHHIAWGYLISRRFSYVPFTLSGKIIALLGTGLISFLMATLIASISSSVTITLAYQRDLFSEPSKIVDKPIAAVFGTHHITISEQLGAIPFTTKDLAQAFSLLENRQVEGVVGDLESLRYYIKQRKIINAHLIDLILRYNEFAFALPFNSELRNALDQKILQLQDSGQMRLICEKYIGPANTKYCEL